MAVLKNFALCVLVLTEISKNMKLVPDTGEGVACFGQNCSGQKRPLAGETVVRLGVVRVVFTAGNYNVSPENLAGAQNTEPSRCRFLRPLLAFRVEKPKTSWTRRVYGRKCKFYLCVRAGKLPCKRASYRLVPIL